MATLKLFKELCFAVMVAACAAVSAAAQANIGKVLFATGEVVIERGPSNKTQVVTPKAQDELLVGDTVITGGNGRVQMQFADGALFSLQPKTRFRIDEYIYSAAQQRGFFSLIRGALRTSSGVIGKKNVDDYKLQTPTATVGIRGTEYLAEETACDPVCAPGRSAGLRVSVSQGKIVVVNLTGSVEVAAGSGAYVPSPTSAPRALDAPILWSSTQQSDVIAANNANAVQQNADPVQVSNAATRSALGITIAAPLDQTQSANVPIAIDSNQTPNDSIQPICLVHVHCV